MTNHSTLIAAFRGGVCCRRASHSVLGLTLVGRTAAEPDELVYLAFSGPTPAGLPEALEDPTVEQLNPKQYRIASPPREWIVEAAAVHLHREVATSFYRAIPPRQPPFTKRLFWRVVLALAANPTGKRLLLALRRR